MLNFKYENNFYVQKAKLDDPIFSTYGPAKVNIALENVIRKVSSNLKLSHDGTLYAQQQILAYAADIDITGKIEDTVRRIFESVEKEAKKLDFK